MPGKVRSKKRQPKQRQTKQKQKQKQPKKKHTKKKKMNKYMIAKEKARKFNNGKGAESFVYNGTTYVRAVTKTGMVIYKRS
jgi:hypothetical protein